MSAAASTVSARAARVSRTEQTARDVRAALLKHSVSQAQVAADTGATPQVVGEWLDDESEKSLRLADARAIGNDDVRRDLAELVAGPRFVLVRRHETSATALTVAEAARMLRAASCAVDTMLVSLSDGVIDPAERREIMRKLEALLVHGEELATALRADDVPAPKAKLAAVRP